MSIQFDKDPAEDLDYGFDLSKWLTGAEQIASVEVTQDPAGLLTLHDDDFSPTEGFVWASGGQAGDRVRLSFKITTNSVPPRVFMRSITVWVKRR